MADDRRVFYVYALRDPCAGDLPFYIGKGTRSRARTHLCPSQRDSARKLQRIHQIRDAGHEPNVTIEIGNLTNTESCREERRLIKLYGREGIDEGGILTNVLIGTSGGPSGKDHPSYGKKNSPETIEKRRANLIGKTGNPGSKNGMFGRTHTSESKAKISAINLGRKHDPESVKSRAEYCKKKHMLKHIEKYIDIIRWHDYGLPKKYIRSEVDCSWDMVTKAIKERDYIISLKDEIDAV